MSIMTLHAVPSPIRDTLARWAKKGAIPLPDLINRLSHWAIRLPLASLLLYYGTQKFPDVFLAPGDYGVPAILFIAAAFAEIFGAAFLIAGGVIETWRPKQGWLRLTGDTVTRLGGLAATAAVGGVIAWFYWDGLTLSDPYAIKLGLALYLVLRGNQA